MPEQDKLDYLQRYLVEEAVEDYQEGHINRRTALKMIAGVLGSMVAASSFLAACAPATAPATAPPAGGGTGASPTVPAAGGASAPSAAAATAAATAGALPTTVAPATSAPNPTVATTPPGTAAAPPSPTAIATQAVLTTTATLSPTPAAAAPGGVRVDPNDPSISAADAEFPGSGGATLLGYLARPVGEAPAPPVLVCHENRGLTDHIRDVTRRLAVAGYVGLAVDLLSRQGGTAKVADASSIPGLLGNMPRDQIVQDFEAGLRYLQEQPGVIRDRPGMVGFCFGGGITWLCATRIPALRAAVPFYGPNPPLEDVPQIQAAVLAMYGALDQRINAGIPEIEQAMKDNGKVFEKIIYEGAAHAFHNDTGQNYNEATARDAWQKTLAWFERYLKG